MDFPSSYWHTDQHPTTKIPPAQQLYNREILGKLPSLTSRNKVPIIDTSKPEAMNNGANNLQMLEASKFVARSLHNHLITRNISFLRSWPCKRWVFKRLIRTWSTGNNGKMENMNRSSTGKNNSSRGKLREAHVKQTFMYIQ